MTHTEYYLLVDGAFEADIVVDWNNRVVSNGDPGSSPTTLEEWIATLEADARESGATFQVYEIPHGDHDVHAECICSQFVLDHLPVWETVVPA